MSNRTMVVSNEKGTWLITDCGACQGRGNLSALHPSGAAIPCSACKATGKRTTKID